MDRLPKARSFLGCWKEDDFSFLFFSRPSAETVDQLVSGLDGVSLVEDYRMSYEEWQGGQVLAPLEAGPFLLHPYWVDVKPKPGLIRVPLDPGLVFGSGFHPTTRESLEALSVLWKLDPPETVMDLGTGTGVLAIAAARLDVSGRLKSVVAVDINPLCVETARRNVEINQLQGKVRVVEGDAEEFVAAPADLVLANLHYGALQVLLENPLFYEKKRAILSGMLRSQADEILRRLDSRPVKVIRYWDDDPVWRTLLMEKL
jgi:ribosomal protein L11 methyltransferase